ILRLLRLVTKIISSTPAATASSTMYCNVGLSMSGSISLGITLLAGNTRVPRPATGNTAFRIRIKPPPSLQEKRVQNQIVSRHNLVLNPFFLASRYVTNGIYHSLQQPF